MATKSREPSAGELKERMFIALGATWQIEGLFSAMGKLAPEMFNHEMLEESAVIRALAMRGQALTLAAMSMLGDTLAPVEQARSVVDGPPDADPDGEAHHA